MPKILKPGEISGEQREKIARKKAHKTNFRASQDRRLEVDASTEFERLRRAEMETEIARRVELYAAVHLRHLEKHGQDIPNSETVFDLHIRSDL